MCTDVACFFPGLIEEKDWSYLETKVREKDKVELTLEYLKECFDYIDGNLYWKKERNGFDRHPYLGIGSEWSSPQEYSGRSGIALSRSG